MGMNGFFEGGGHQSRLKGRVDGAQADRTRAHNVNLEVGLLLGSIRGFGQQIHVVCVELPTEDVM